MITLPEIEEKIIFLTENVDKESFLYCFLEAYDFPKATIAKVKKGISNKAIVEGDILLKGKLYYSFQSIDNNVHELVKEIRNKKEVIKNKPIYIILTDFKQFVAYDEKYDDSIDILFEDLPAEYAFFRPLAGYEKTRLSEVENPANIKASEKMAKIYEQIRRLNPTFEKDNQHDLNVFLCRLLFCFFAEDTGVFASRGCFTASIKDQTIPDGSDLGTHIQKVFNVLSDSNRKSLSTDMEVFPYVNGGLFSEQVAIPQFDRKTRAMMIDCGDLDWAKINPDIFGSMMQAVADPEKRSSLGMHYTSLENIMKVINPLFLDDLYEEFYRSKNDVGQLNRLLDRVIKIKIFDPACGSGNFLIIAYKELRMLEMKILFALQDAKVQKAKSLKKSSISEAQLLFICSEIKLSRFYGIEIDDFAHEVAMLSLWLIEHQMNLVFDSEFGSKTPSLPLKEKANIVCGNACRLNWEEVCPKSSDEVFILGNPPYLGARMQSSEQKSDIENIFINNKSCNSFDYITCWFYKASQYLIDSDFHCAFVSTNSIIQGEHVGLFWPSIIIENNSHITFAHNSFLWSNRAKSKAAVYVVIVGISHSSRDSIKRIYSEGNVTISQNISPYLTSNNNVFLKKRTVPICDVPPLVYGNQCIDGGHLIINDLEKEKLLSEYPESNQFVRPLLGAEDYVKGQTRWCIWIKEDKLDKAMKIPYIENRINEVLQYRMTGGEVARSLIDIPYRFRYIHEANNNLLILPRTTSERRHYLTIGFLDKKYVVTDAAQVIYDPPVWVFSILSSKVHISWVKRVAGRLKMDPRYSNTICYNNFPFPSMNETNKGLLKLQALDILSAREQYPELTISELYDPKKMPQNLLKAHQENDRAVEKCYRDKPFTSDEERLEHLFALYEKMIAEESKK